MWAMERTTWRCGQTVIRNRCVGFECFTADLHRLAAWLQSCGVKTVALQSTGVYWIPLYDILEERGFEVYLLPLTKGQISFAAKLAVAAARRPDDSRDAGGTGV